MRYLVCAENDITTYLRNYEGDPIFVSNIADARKILAFHYSDTDGELEYEFLEYDLEALKITFRIKYDEELQWTEDCFYLIPLIHIKDVNI